MGSEDIEYGAGGCENLIRELLAAGVVLSIEGDRLAFDAPEGVLSGDLLGRMRAHREELLGLIERFKERAANVEHDGELSRAEAERLAWSCVLGDPAGDDPEPSGSSVASSISCPWCRSDDLIEDPEGIRCRGCDRMAWLDLPGGGWVRVNRSELDPVEVDPDSVPVCSVCGRLCDVDRGPLSGMGGRDPVIPSPVDRHEKTLVKNGETTSGSWSCSRCDPGADRRRAVTDRWAGLARKMVGLRAAGASRPVGELAHRDRLPESVGVVDDPVAGECCPRCGSDRSHVVPVHGGESLRRDCSGCGRFLGNPVWHDAAAVDAFVADLEIGSRRRSL